MTTGLESAPSPRRGIFPASAFATSEAPSDPQTAVGTDPWPGGPRGGDFDWFPKWIGRYEIRDLIGQGGFGLVYLARDPNMRKRDIALKVPRPELWARHDHRVLVEAQAWAALPVHGRVVTIFTVEDKGQVPFLVMEYCDGGSLAQWLDDQPGGDVPTRLAARIVAEIADGVAHAHAHGILHRDLKPGNILIKPEEPGLDGLGGIPVVTDFGLARHLDGEDDRIGEAPHGTHPYSPPEQTGGRAKEIGERSDVYGLAAILYRLLVGRPPFIDDDRDRLLERVRDEPPTPPRSLREDVPVALEAIVLKGLAKRPEDRHASVRELAAELRRFERGELEGPVPRRPWDHLWWQIRRRLIAIVGAVALAALLPTLFAWGWAQRQQHALTALEMAQPESFADWIPTLSVRTRWVADRLETLHNRSDDRLKFAAALALAPVRPELGDEAYDRWLDGRPEVLLPLLPLLRDRIPGLADRLRAECVPPEEEPPLVALLDGAAEKRRAHAAIALMGLGQDAPAWKMLRHRPNPQDRSYLIHRLGPAGITPRRLLDRLHHEPDVSARRALILALGEYPDHAWKSDANVRGDALADILNLYDLDPDPGIHGAAKWLLRRWAEGPDGATIAAARRRIDDRLTGQEREGFGWRIAPSSLTLVRLTLPDGAVVELADEELTVGFCREVEGTRIPFPQICPTDDCSMDNLDLKLSLAACEVLNQRDGLAPKDGYRPPDLDEFLYASNAEAKTQSFFGTAPDLLGYYACYATGDDFSIEPPGRRKPNDFGLFDTIGNVNDLCTDPKHQSGHPVTSIGGWAGASANTVMCRSSQAVYENYFQNMSVGFRPARTLRPSPQPPQ